MPPEYTALRATPTVRLNGQEHERLTHLVTAMSMTEQVGGLSALELRVSNSAPLNTGSVEYAFDAGGDVALGAEIIIGAGDVTAPIEIFRGRISGLEGLFGVGSEPELVILAEDALQKLRLARRSRVFEDQSLADIVQTIASVHGLTPQITRLTERFGTQVQMNETDLAFLRRLLGRVDADMQVVGTDLQVSPRSDVRRGEIDLELHGDLRSVRVVADLAHQATSAKAKGWDVAAGSALEATASSPVPGPGQGDDGGPLLQNAFAERAVHIGNVMTFNQAEADAVAGTAWSHRSRQLLRAHGVAQGTPNLRVGTHVRLRGVGDWFSNTFYVVKARHLFDLREGYRVEFEAECAWLGRSA